MSRQDKAPLVSVAMIVYNGERFLAEAIESVLKQTWPHWELVIVDDGSNDRTETIIKRYLFDKRLRYLKQPHLGRPKARNRALSKSRGKYVAVLDADDRALPDRLAEQVKVLEDKPRLAAVGSWAYFINEQGERIGEIRKPVSYTEILKLIMRYGVVVHSSLMIRKRTLKKLGGYNEWFSLAEDYELMLRLLREHEIENLPKFLVDYRVPQSGAPTTHRIKEGAYASLARLKALLSYDYRRGQDIEDFLINLPFIFISEPWRLKLRLWWRRFRKMRIPGSHD